ncbi:HNH endonuclease [Pseudoduganella albidiflava]|uniref:HNH endonuclease n=1 Tax=Pseudoduganella albidiflava TaxID=321983 RepID=A0A411WZW7_9BURK|nr:HNH endonuclease signature motif containing protein [Pseudoduganella albidiflava]QBI02238.1 HNH endonuclease [Pseudoduganella albidiflava]GGY59432.1 HNH endonuclease [Pseudoduganella albidiflava]
MSVGRPPSPEEQIAFLRSLQRLLNDGDFTSTYKYALLMALAELSVELGDDSGAPLDVPLRKIAEKFALYYWPQSAPFTATGIPGETVILSQNLGKQAAIVGHLVELRVVAPTWSLARQHPQWQRTITLIARTVRDMPVKYLQNVDKTVNPFLFEPFKGGGSVRLHSGVACNLRSYQGFVQQLVRAGWLNHVRGNGRNAPALGRATDLEVFMFGTRRAALGSLVLPLSTIQDGKCFFCSGRCGADSAVDHFIPWSRYPRDNALNFVLAHASCNNDKRDLLAAPAHLERWLERNERFGAGLREEAQTAGFLTDDELATPIARWAYTQALRMKSSAWVRRGVIEPMDPSVIALFPGDLSEIAEVDDEIGLLIFHNPVPDTID